MTFDITEDDLPLRVRVRLRDRGWRFDRGVQEWRKADFSPHAADHQRAWAPTIVAVTTEVEAEEQREADAAQSQVDAEKARVASQMNATPGDTGTSDYNTD